MTAKMYWCSCGTGMSELLAFKRHLKNNPGHHKTTGPLG